RSSPAVGSQPGANPYRCSCRSSQTCSFYYLFPMTWRDALRYCSENHVDLVSVLTNETQEWVETVTKNVSTPNVWMGLRHTRTLGFWYWVSGECIWYQNWAPENRTGVEDCSNGERSGAVHFGYPAS
uniref:C-type lectin domain-containing protein n=1 Tax=Electrophorus electricus TaxID=8005 RepID=A0A4W4E2F4_ELEEL